MTLPILLSAIRARVEAATPGPWTAELVDDWSCDTGFAGDPPKKLTGWIEGVVEYKSCGSHEAKWKPGCLELVTHAPTDIALLLKIVDKLLEQRDGYIERLDERHGDAPYDNVTEAFRQDNAELAALAGRLEGDE